MVFRIKRSKQVKYRLVTFADGGPLWDRTVKRLVREAKKSGYFSGVDVYNLSKIKESLPAFYEKNRHFIESNPRGFGYWIWKPAIVRHSLQNLKQKEAGIIYVDSGCTINPLPAARSRYFDYIQMSEKSGALFFYLRGHKVRNWTKIDTQKRMQLTESILNASQLVGGIFLISKSSNNVSKLLTDWQEFAESDNYHHLDDSSSTSSEPTTFIEHRHDQALLSALVYSRDMQTIPDESWFENGWTSTALQYPIWATRTKSGISHFATGPYWYLLKHWENLKDRFDKSEYTNIISFYFRNR